MARMQSADWASIRWFNPEDVPFWGKISRALLFGIDRMAARLRLKPIFTSTWRSPEENLRVKGSAKSLHLDGDAADLVFPGKPLEEVYQAAREEGFKGIGLYPEKDMIHVDTRQKPGTWSRIAGAYLGLTAAFDWLQKKKTTAILVGLVAGAIGLLLLKKAKGN